MAGHPSCRALLGEHPQLTGAPRSRSRPSSQLSLPRREQPASGASARTVLSPPGRTFITPRLRGRLVDAALRAGPWPPMEALQSPRLGNGQLQPGC